MREISDSMTAWWWSLRFSCRASPSTTEEEGVLEEGGAVPGEGLRLPSLSLTIYRGKGRRRLPRVSLGEGRRPQGKP